MYMHIVYIQYTLCEVLNEVPTHRHLLLALSFPSNTAVLPDICLAQSFQISVISYLFGQHLLNVVGQLAFNF